MTCNTAAVHITRSTWCSSSDANDAHYQIDFENPIPLGRPSLLYIGIDWQPDWEDGTVKLKFRRQNESSGGADVRFDSAAGEGERTFTGDVSPHMVTIVGVNPTLGEQADLLLEITVDDEVQPTIPIFVRQEQRVAAEEGISLLKRETAIAAQATRPTDAAAARIWDHYNTMYSDARAFAQVLPNIENFPASADIPTISGRIEAREFDLSQITAHLQTEENRGGIAANKARTHTDAFDAFQGQWRGNWRQKNACDYAEICQDHQWRETQHNAEYADIYQQAVVLGPDSRPYVEGASLLCLNLEPGRDYDTAAVNTINISSGVLVGAVGVNNQADEGGVRAQRPHIGFYIDSSKLLWVAQEGLENERVSYSVFIEESVADIAAGNFLYTITGFDFKWNRAQSQILDINTKGGQYTLAGADRALVAAFMAHQLTPEHLAQMRYRRALEAMNVEQVQAFVDNTTEATPQSVRDYLQQLLDFVGQQQALREAPEGDRENIVFIVGEDPPPGTQNAHNAFYRAAEAHFTLHPEGRLIVNLRTLREVRNYLANNPPANGLPWGQVSVVVHANEQGYLEAPVDRNYPDEFTEGTNMSILQQAIDEHRLTSLPDDIFDVRTTLRLRGCDIGGNQPMLELLSRAFGGDDIHRPIVRAPRYAQSYEFTPDTWTDQQGAEDLSSTDEYLANEYELDFPGNPAFSHQQLLHRFQQAYPMDNITIAEVTRRISFPLTANVELEFTYLPDNAQGAANRRVHQANLDTNVDTSDWANWSIQSRTVLPDGSIRFVYEFTTTDGTTNTVQIIYEPGPEHTNAARTAHLVSRYGQHFVDQYNWAYHDSNHTLDDGTMVRRLNATGSRIVHFVFRPITEADPDYAGQQRRVRPQVTDINYYGEEVPARPAEHPLGENVLPH